MQPMLYFLLVLVLSVIKSIQSSSGHGLVNPQSACNIRCENGGMCAFSFENPHFHSCICLLGVYEGDRCQFKVGVPRESSNSVRQLHHKTSVSQHRSLSTASTSTMMDNKMREKEMEEQRNEQRRKEYDQKLDAERREYERRIETERRRTEDSRPIGVLPATPQRNEMEQRRIDELRRRDEELRRSAFRRREEERRREQEKRLKEEQRRKELAMQEEQRLREEQRRIEEQKVKEMHEKEKTIMTPMTMDKSTTYSIKSDSKEVDDDAEAPNLEEWDYKSDEEDTTNDYITGGGQEIGDDDLDIHERTTTIENTKTSTENVQTESLDGITGFVEMAADKTIKIHGIEIDKDSSTVGPNEDDYWDHSIKRDDENYRISEEDSKEHSDTVFAQTNEIDHKFNVEESEEGWMMMKRVDEDSFAVNISLTTVILSLILRIW